MTNVCLFCHQNGVEIPAKFVAPQRSELSGPWDYVPVCAAHADGWWDGSDYPDGRSAPAILSIPDEAINDDVAQRGFVVVVALKVNVTADSREEARAKAIELLNEQMEDREPWGSSVPSWQTLNVKPERTDDPLDSEGDERVWASSDYERDDLAGTIDYEG